MPLIQSFSIEEAAEFLMWAIKSEKIGLHQAFFIHSILWGLRGGIMYKKGTRFV